MGSDYFKQMSIALFFLLAVPATVVLRQKTQVGFYSRSCPRVEAIVQSAVKSQFNSNPTVVPGLFIMHFHDCFVQGCDGSILINGDGTEKMAGPNHLLRGYEVIDDAKTQLEAACPSVISCADILALVACDAVILAGGLGWVVPTGGRDGRVSLASDASNLPGFTDSIDVQKQKFAEKRSQYSRSCHPWGHNIGTSACPFFRYKLYNFNSTTGADPSIDSAFLPQLRSLCPENGDSSKRVGLDGRSENMFDNSFFTNMRNGCGILESDQKLWTDDSTKTFVQRFLGIRGLVGLTFSAEFGKSMVKVSNIEVKTGTNGEIRKFVLPLIDAN